MAYVIAQNRGRMVLSAMRIEKLQAVKDACLAHNKNMKDTDILILELDITKVETIKDCFQKVIQHFGTVSSWLMNI